MIAMAGPPQIIDAHVHVWDATARHHAWLADAPELAARYLPSDLSAGRHRLAGVIVVQADCRDDEALDEVDWVAGLAADHPLIRGMVADAPLERGPAAAAPVLDALAQRPLVVGVRRLLQDEPAERLAEPELAAGIAAVGERGWPFDLCVRAHQLRAAEALVARCPQVTFVLDHLGKPPVAHGALDPWRADLRRLAAHPNVRCKLSGLITEAGTPDWQPAQLRPFLEYALEVFGPRRCLAASDWPLVEVDGSAERWFDLLLDVVDGSARPAVLVETARETYGLVEAPAPIAEGTGARRHV